MSTKQNTHIDLMPFKMWQSFFFFIFKHILSLLDKRLLFEMLPSAYTKIDVLPNDTFSYTTTDKFDIVFKSMFE